MGRGSDNPDPSRKAWRIFGDKFVGASNAQVCHVPYVGIDYSQHVAVDAVLLDDILHCNIVGRDHNAYEQRKERHNPKQGRIAFADNLRVQTKSL